MDYLPLFADIRGQPVLVVGGGDVAARKIALLRRVEVVSPYLCEQLAELVGKQQLIWRAQHFTEDLLDNVLLVIAATNDSELNHKVSDTARARHCLVNVVDDQASCSFIFPSIVDRSPLVVAISSGGTAPVLTRLLREKLEALLPAALGQMATLAGEWREKVKQRFRKIAERRRFWESAFNGLFASQVASGNPDAARQALEAQLAMPDVRQGEITLVGAGPGDPGLLTLHALQAMQQADVVLYDHLVSVEVLDLVRRDAERICVGKRAGAHHVAQQETNRLLVMLARQGKRVVRLKGGDPFIFGRGGEELQVAAAAGIPFQVVPGVTAATGAAAYAGITLTHRDYSQSVIFITGHCRANCAEIDWWLMARPHQTVAIYMGALKVAEISQQLIIHGRDPTTPVAVISCGTRTDQRVLTGFLSELEQLAQDAPTPALLIIGEVVKLHADLAWFQQSLQPVSRNASVITLA